MATRIPPHNLREVAAGVTWALDHPDATDEELLEELIKLIPGPDFPTKGLIVGRDGIEDAYRTGRGSIRMRAVVTVEEDVKGRTILVVTELPYQVNPDNLVESIAMLAKEGKVAGIADINDESSDRIGMRIVVTLKRDAVAKVVLNNLFKHTQLQTTFGANMLAIVDGVPRTLRLDQFISLYVEHQIEVIVRRTRYLLRIAEERAHILRGYLKALDQLDAVIALIRRSPSADEAKTGSDGTAGDRRDPGRRDPRPAVAPAGRTRAPADHRRGRRDRVAHRRPQRHPGQARPAAADHPRRDERDRRQVRRRPAHRSWCPTTATCRWKT